MGETWSSFAAVHIHFPKIIRKNSVSVDELHAPTKTCVELL
jgi:hypothetical protein